MIITTVNPETEDLVIQLSKLTGETLESAISHAVKEKLDRLVSVDREAYRARVMAAIERMAKLPVLDTRSPDEIIGYNENGHFE